MPPFFFVLLPPDNQYQAVRAVVTKSLGMLFEKAIKDLNSQEEVHPKVNCSIFSCEREKRRAEF